jgi:hypothetical protein
MPERHFPPPWSVEELDSCFVVKDANGQALAYMYFEKEPLSRVRRLPFLSSCRSCWASDRMTRLPKKAGLNRPHAAEYALPIPVSEPFHRALSASLHREAVRKEFDRMKKHAAILKFIRC